MDHDFIMIILKEMTSHRRDSKPVVGSAENLNRESGLAKIITGGLKGAVNKQVLNRPVVKSAEVICEDALCKM